ncbi:MAG: GxxExxY protein [Bacteroidaceae bacterium]|nr:GxxExxY protein [Bacteroidaceae bacterium]
MDRTYTYRILRCLYNVYDELGPGLLESIYEEATVKELKENGFTVDRQMYVPVFYRGEQLQADLRLDIMIDKKVILELKSVLEYRKIFEKQLFTYLRLTNCELGYVVNYNVEDLRDGIIAVHNHSYHYG